MRVQNVAHISLKSITLLVRVKECALNAELHVKVLVNKAMCAKSSRLINQLSFSKSYHVVVNLNFIAKIINITL